MLDVFLTLPPVTEEPRALLPSMDKLENVMHAARTARQLLSEEKMGNFLLMEQEIRNYKPTLFSEMLPLFSNVNVPAVASIVLPDPSNIRMEKFMIQNKEYVAKVWKEIEEEIDEAAGVSNVTEVLPAEADDIVTLQNLDPIDNDVIVEPSLPKVTTKKKRGRKSKQPSTVRTESVALPSTADIPQKKRGRPKGSKNATTPSSSKKSRKND